MKNDTQKTFSPTAVDFLAYIEGSMSESESRRFQDAVCADPVLHEELCNRRRDHWKRVTLPALSDLGEELAQWDSPELGLGPGRSSDPESWNEHWKRIQGFCTRIGGDLVAGIESLGDTIRSIADTPWVPVPAATRLGRNLPGGPPAGPSVRNPDGGAPGRIHLQRGGGSLLIRPIVGGFEFTVRLPGKAGGRVELKGPAGDGGDAGDVLTRLPRSQVAHLEDGESTLRLDVRPGIHTVVIEIDNPGRTPTRWVCLVNRVD